MAHSQRGPGPCSPKRGPRVGGGGGLGLALGFGLGLGLGLGRGGGGLWGGWRLPRYSRSGFLGFLGAWGGGVGNFGGGSPLPAAGRGGGGAAAAPPATASLPFLLPHPHPTLALRAHAPPPPPPLLPASHLANPYSTERAKLGSFPNIQPNSVTPTRCDRPPPPRHPTYIPRGSAPHVCRRTT